MLLKVMGAVKGAREPTTSAWLSDEMEDWEGGESTLMTTVAADEERSDRFPGSNRGGGGVWGGCYESWGVLRRV